MKLFIPGPVQVREDILREMARPPIGHRTPEFRKLFAEIKEGLKYLFQTQNDVLVSTSSGSGFWEAAIRNCTHNQKSSEKILHAVNGAFSRKWADVSRRCGRQVDIIEFGFGQPVDPSIVAKKLGEGNYSMFCMVHNETSTGVVSNLKVISEAIEQFKEAGLIWAVDAVSSIGGIDIKVDDLGIDICLASSQKAMALPPGISFASVSRKAYERAKTIDCRGYYFDLLELKKMYDKDMTPYTPSIPHLYALRRQLQCISAEGIENRFVRHSEMATYTRAWVIENGFSLFSQEEFCSDTITCVENSKGTDLTEVKNRMLEKEYLIDIGYRAMNKILSDEGKNQTFRLPHMGDLETQDMETFLLTLKKEIT
ncbi:alanine--glyoxylate aminotransferase family protein [Candidatus Woesearchaeota archaeon]|nr:alanine--glyoxylate aminotransferase family protein [Candidatus Woesearchaeota archaeon]